MSTFRSGDSTFRTAECHASAVFLAPFGGQRMNPTEIQARFPGVRWITFWIVLILKNSGHTCGLPERFVKWVLSDTQITGTIVPPAWSWCCVSHHSSPMFIALNILRLSESARRTGSTSGCAWTGRCGRRNCKHLKISQEYNAPKMCEWFSIQPSLVSPKSTLERSFRRASADWNNSILTLSSPHLRCWSIHVFVSWLNNWACWKSCADWNGCHRFHCSEYLRCLLYNPVALQYGFPPAFSTPTTCLGAQVFVGSGVHVRSGFWWSRVSSSGVSSGGCAPATLSKDRWISWLNPLMAILVHRLKSNHDGSG